MKDSGRDNTAGGFTLSEIVVVITLFGIFMLSAFAVFKGTFETWRLSEARTQAFENAQVPLEMIAREIRSALVNDRADERRFDFLGFGLDADLVGENDQTNNMKKDPLNPGWRTGSTGDEIYFIAALNPGGDSEAEFCEIGYYLDEGDPNKYGDEVLRRFYVHDGQHPDKSVEGEFDYEFRTPPEVPEGGLAAPGREDTYVIAEGVAGFRVWYWCGDGENDDGDRDVNDNPVIDEEVEDGRDDDGDGRIDEDLGWQNSWDSRRQGFNGVADTVHGDGREKGRMPPAVKVRISVRDEYARVTRDFVAVISPPTARPEF